jgi:hypothetical protein
VRLYSKTSVLEVTDRSAGQRCLSDFCSMECQSIY